MKPDNKTAQLYWAWSTLLNRYFRNGDEANRNDGRVNDVIVLAHLSLNPTATTEELAEVTGLSLPSMSRNMRRLSKENRQGTPGMGLINIRRDPREGRRYLHSLSDLGIEALEKFAA